MTPHNSEVEIWPIYLASFWYQLAWLVFETIWYMYINMLLAVYTNRYTRSLYHPSINPTLDEVQLGVIDFLKIGSWCKTSGHSAKRWPDKHLQLHVVIFFDTDNIWGNIGWNIVSLCICSAVSLAQICWTSYKVRANSATFGLREWNMKFNLKKGMCTDTSTVMWITSCIFVHVW